MREPHGKTYRPWEPERYQHEAQSPAAKLPGGDLVFFLLDTVRRLDVRRFYAPYEQETRGAPPFDPAMMVCLLLYAYCVGVFSSRKIALACERNLAFLAIVGHERPDFRTISVFRKLHLDAFADCLRPGAPPGGRRAWSAGHDRRRWDQDAGQCVATQGDELWLHDEGRGPSARRDRDLADAGVPAGRRRTTRHLGSRRGDELPEELADVRIAWRLIEAAMRRLEAEAKAAADVERQRRAEAEAERHGRANHAVGKPPDRVETPADKAQTNFTDPELSIMRTTNKGWEYCGNAQASVDATCQIIVACDVTDQCNDKQQAEPMAQATLSTLDQAGIARPQSEAGEAQAIPATLDTGYYSAAAAQALED